MRLHEHPQPPLPIEPVTRPMPTETESKPQPPWRRAVPAAASAIVGFLLLMLLALLFAGDPTPNSGAGVQSPDASSLAANKSHSVSPTTSETQSSPSTASEPSPEPLSLREAGRSLVQVVNAGIAAGEVGGGIVEEVQDTIDAVFQPLEDDQDRQDALDAIEELQAKVGEALDNGEISSSETAQAIDDALDKLGAALEAQE